MASVQQTQIHHSTTWDRLKLKLPSYLAYFFLTAGAIISLVPFFVMIMRSFMSQTQASSSDWIPNTWNWQNYIVAWDISNFAEYFGNTVIVTFIIVIGNLIFCTLAAYAFSHMTFPGKNLIFSMIIITLMLPQAISWVPNFITVSWLGRLTPIEWLDNWPALTIPFMASAFGILILRQFFQQIPSELYDSARIDGAGHIRYLFRIVLPLSRAPLMTVSLFSFIGAWDSLAWPILVTSTEKWRPISYGLFNFFEEGGGFINLQMAGSVITALPILIVFFFAQKQFIEGISRSGLKG